MHDSFNRKISYIRISVTDRCNLKCKYCITEATEFIPRDQVLSREKIVEVAQTAISMGFNKIRLTGGEPLVRPDIIEIVSDIAKIEGLEDFAMTTNAIMLKGMAADLKAAGLHRLNIHLDTIESQKFSDITCGGKIDSVLDGIREAKRVGFTNFKMNCVISEWNTAEDKEAIRAFALAEGIHPQFIRQMNLAKGEFWPVEGGAGGRCGECNRIRMSCDGKIYPCLFSDQAYDIAELGIEGAIKLAIHEKPESGTKAVRNFNTLGG